MRKPKRAEPRIADPATHPRRNVCLRVAAEFLDIDERTLRAYVFSGDLEAFRAGRVYRIPLTALVAFKERGMGPEPVSRESARHT